MPFVTIGDREFRVEFSYSSHNAKRLAEPGSARQFINHIALSLRRRVALAEIALIEPIRLTPNGDATAGIVPLGYGFAVCHYTDQFSKSDARGLSLLRALKNARFADGSALSRAERNDIASAFGFFDYEYLKEQYSSHKPDYYGESLAKTLTESGARASSLAGLMYPQSRYGANTTAAMAAKHG